MNKYIYIYNITTACVLAMKFYQSSEDRTEHGVITQNFWRP